MIHASRALQASFTLPLALLASILITSGCSPAMKMENDEKVITHSVTPADIARAASRQRLDAPAAVLYVNGLGCPLCATNIDLQLQRVPGVTDVKVDLSVGKVDVGLLRGKQPSHYALAQAVEDAGFTLVKIEEHTRP